MDMIHGSARVQATKSILSVRQFYLLTVLISC